jgi:glutamate 5-kinase
MLSEDKKKLIVVKIGTSSLTHRTANWTYQKETRDQAAEAPEKASSPFGVIWAVASGMAELDVVQSGRHCFQTGVCCCGQSILMAHYRALQKHGLKVAQILLTKEDLSNRAAYLPHQFLNRLITRRRSNHK